MRTGCLRQPSKVWCRLSLGAALLIAAPGAHGQQSCFFNYGIPQVTCGGASCSGTFTFTPPDGTPAGTTFTVYTYAFPDLCATVPAPVVHGTTTSTTYTVTGMARERYYGAAVGSPECPATITAFAPLMPTFSTPSVKSILTAAVTGPDEVTLTVSQSEGRLAYPIWERSQDGGTFRSFSSANLCPNGSVKTYVDRGRAEGRYRYRLDFLPRLYLQEFSNEVSVLIGCPAPAAVTFTTPASLEAGATTSLRIRPAQGGTIEPDATLEVDLSRDAFATVEATVRSPAGNEVLIRAHASSSAYTLSLRARAVASCGTAGPASAPVSLAVRPAPARFVVTAAPAALAAAVGGAPPSTSLTVRNVGGTAGTIAIAAAPGFVRVEPARADVGPGLEATLAVTATSAAAASAAFYSGLVVLDGGRPLSVPLSLTVSDAPPEEGARLVATPSSVTLAGPPATPPGARTIQVTNVGTGSAPMTADVGPGGSWLGVAGDLSRPLPPGQARTLTLTDDRESRSAPDGSNPLRALLAVTPAGLAPESAALVEVVDLEPFAVSPGSGVRGGPSAPRSPLADPPPAGTSFILPTAVKAAGRNDALFTTDAWLRNVDSGPVPAQLFFTPDGQDGLTGPGVLRAQLTVPAGGTLRLPDLLPTTFGVEGTGQVEVRSDRPGALRLRAAVESVTRGDATTRFGSEIEAVRYGSGAKTGGGALIVAGIDDDADHRANLILAETTGAGVRARVELHDAGGALRGASSFDVPAYGKVQVNRIVDALVPGQNLSGASLAVRAESGGGAVIPLATVIDNRSNSFSAVLGRGAGTGLPASRAALASGAGTYLIPAVVRTTGLFDTRFGTDLAITNGTAQPATLTLTYRYVDSDDGGRVKSAARTVTLPPRGSMPAGQARDALVNLFGVSARSYGSILVQGDVARVVAVATITSLVDPSDPAKGTKTAQVTGALVDSPLLMSAGNVEHAFAGAEKSVQRRTNLILVEAVGQPCRARVLASAPTGEPLAERTVDVGPDAYVQINDVFGDQGVALGSGPFQNVEIAVQVTSGAGRVMALATVNDNVSRNPQVFVLTSPGPAGPTVGF